MLITDPPVGQSKAGCGNQIPGASSWRGLTTNEKILGTNDHQWANIVQQLSELEANANIGEAAAASNDRKRKVTLIRRKISRSLKHSS